MAEWYGRGPQSAMESERVKKVGMDLSCVDVVEFARDMNDNLDNCYVESHKDKNICNDERVLRQMLEREKNFPGVNYFTRVQTELKPHMRKIVLDWMMEVCEEQRCHPEVFILAVNYMDRFLQHVNIKKNQFQLVASVCLLLASKLRGSPILLSALVGYTDNSLLTEEIKEWEIFILAILNWNLSVLTPLPYVNLFLHQLNLTKLQGQVDQLILLLQSDLHLSCECLPSVVASAAILSVYENTDPNKDDLENLVKDLTSLAKVSRQSLSTTYIRLQSLLHDQFVLSLQDHHSQLPQCQEYELYKENNLTQKLISSNQVTFNTLVC